jgi:hypothetical protein
MKLTSSKVVGSLLVASPLFAAQVLAACSSNDTNPIFYLTVDAGTDTGTQPTPPSPVDIDTGMACPTGQPIAVAQASTPDAGESGSPGDAGEDVAIADSSVNDAPPERHARIHLVAASNNLAAMRFCFGQGQQDDGSDFSVVPFAALPDKAAAGQAYPGIARGESAVLPDLADLSGIALTPFVIDATKIASVTSDAGLHEATCDKLIGSDGKGGTLNGSGVYRLPTIAKDTFHDATYLLAPYDCPAGADAGSCTGMGVVVKQLLSRGAALPLPGTPPSIDVTVANVAPAVSALDASFACQSMHAPLAFGDIDPEAPTRLTDLGAELWFNAKIGGAAVRSRPEALQTIFGATKPVAEGVYTFALLGDPAAEPASLPDGTANPNFNGAGLHFIALDNYTDYGSKL